MYRLHMPPRLALVSLATLCFALHCFALLCFALHGCAKGCSALYRQFLLLLCNALHGFATDCSGLFRVLNCLLLLCNALQCFAMFFLLCNGLFYLPLHLASLASDFSVSGQLVAGPEERRAIGREDLVEPGPWIDKTGLDHRSKFRSDLQNTSNATQGHCKQCNVHVDLF